MDLNGKRVIVTGGARRVGAAIVRAFANAGAKVVIHCNTSADEAYALLDAVGGENAGHSVIRFDLADTDAVPAFMNLLPDDLAVLVNNASIFDLVKKYPDGMMTKINFDAPKLLSETFFTHSKAELPAVVNILDNAIYSGAESEYLDSKRKLAEYTLSVAKKFAPRMRINGIAPGPVMPPPGLEHMHMQKTLPTLPLHRPVKPEDVADAVLLAASCDSMTGAIIPLAG